MLCEKCSKRTATTYIKRTVNGVTKEYHLCPECAAQLGFSNFSLFDDIGDIWSSFFNNTGFSHSALSTKRCKTCNSSFDEILESGKMGCPDCYSVFREEILPTLEKIHGNTEYKGGMPEGISVTKEPETEEEKLQADLKAAIENEEFEKAAEIRDKLKEMRKKDDE